MDNLNSNNLNFNLAQLFQNPPSQDDCIPARLYRGSTGSRAVGSANQTTKRQLQFAMMNSKDKSVFERNSYAIGVNPKLNAWSPTIRQPSNGEIREILAAIKNNDINKIQEMILIGIDLDATNFNQDRPIDIIISQNKIQLIELLITMNVFDINNKESNSMIDINTALVAAIKEQRFEILKLLITYINSNQNIQENIPYQDIFEMAVTCGDTKIAKLLIEETSFKINYLYGWGESALMKAIALQNCEMVKLLIEHGADVNLPDKINCSPLERAVRAGDKDISELLLQKGSKNEKLKVPTYYLGENEISTARKNGLINQINNLEMQPESLIRLSKNAVKKAIVEANGKTTSEKSVATLLEGLCMPKDENKTKISLEYVDTQDASENETIQSLELLKGIPKKEIKDALPKDTTLRDIIPIGVQLDYGVTEEAIYRFLRENGEPPRLMHPRDFIN